MKPCLLAAFCWFSSVLAQDPELPSISRPASSNEKAEPGLPIGNPETQAPPELLPESTALPTPIPLPHGLGLKETPAGSPSPSPISEEERRANERRLTQIRAIATETARAKYLRQQASTALSAEARRNYLRAYYITVCTEMRRMEPRLSGSIQDFLRERLHQISRAKDFRLSEQ